MAAQSYKYVIVGAGLAGASAIDGIRERDAQGSILLIGSEADLPYDRPPLSKQLWFGTKQVDEIFLHDRKFYERNGVELALDTQIVALDIRAKTIGDARGRRYTYEKLLLATGGRPRKLSIPGGDLPGLCYFRSLADYRRLRGAAAEGKSAVVIGGGFIGSELAAALRTNKLEVTMVFPGSYLCSRVFPESLGRALLDRYVEHGIQVHAGDAPVEITRNDGKYTTRTRGGLSLASDLVVIGVGIDPAIDLAAAAGLQIGDGIVVNEYLQTSDPSIYAAGDNAFFPYPALGETARVEHWDNAVNQGKWAGRNMAGAGQPYTYMPLFFSDLFDFGYEAVGDVSATLPTWADWQEENRTGVVYYLRDERVCGVMLCNVWEKVEQARELIRGRQLWKRDALRGAIR